MNLFRKRTASTPAAPGERRCRACGNGLADDQLACLDCGAVDGAAGGRERRWLLPTSGVATAALLLVTSASFAASTALNTGDPEAIKKNLPAPVAQAPIPPASGDGSVPNTAEEGGDKGPDLGDLPGGGAGDPGGDAAAPPADYGAADAPADDGADDGADSGNDSGGSAGGGSGSTPKPDKPDKPEQPAVKVSEWPDGDAGYTVLVYKFNDKSGAKRKAQEVAAKGLPAGIVDSDKYASLEPGSWLVYIGQFDSAKQAEKAAAKYENAGYPGDVTFVGQTETPESDDDAGGSKATPQQP